MRVNLLVEIDVEGIKLLRLSEFNHLISHLTGVDTHRLALQRNSGVFINI